MGWVNDDGKGRGRIDGVFDNIVEMDGRDIDRGLFERGAGGRRLVPSSTAVKAFVPQPRDGVKGLCFVRFEALQFGDKRLLQLVDHGDDALALVVGGGVGGGVGLRPGRRPMLCIQQRVSPW